MKLKQTTDYLIFFFGGGGGNFVLRPSTLWSFEFSPYTFLFKNLSPKIVAKFEYVTIQYLRLCFKN